MNHCHDLSAFLLMADLFIRQCYLGAPISSPKVYSAPVVPALLLIATLSYRVEGFSSRLQLWAPPEILPLIFMKTPIGHLRRVHYRKRVFTRGATDTILVHSRKAVDMVTQQMHAPWNSH